MYLLDTNAVSEMRRVESGRGHPNVKRWAHQSLEEAMFLSSIVVFEVELGVELMRRKDPAQAKVLGDWLHIRIMPAFRARILSVDIAVALRCAGLHVPKTAPFRDSLIAATALVHGMTVVTRNVKDFAPLGVAVLNPWDA